MKCCYIGRFGLKCGRAAVVRIVATTGHPEDDSLSCELHVGLLLGSITDAPWGSYGWEIRVLEGASW